MPSPFFSILGTVCSSSNPHPHPETSSRLVILIIIALRHHRRVTLDPMLYTDRTQSILRGITRMKKYLTIIQATSFSDTRPEHLMLVIIIVVTPTPLQTQNLRPSRSQHVKIPAGLLPDMTLQNQHTCPLPAAHIASTRSPIYPTSRPRTRLSLRQYRCHAIRVLSPRLLGHL